MLPSIFNATIDREEAERLVNYSHKKSPKESCGIIGIQKRNGEFILKPILLRNESKSNNTFKISRENKLLGAEKLRQLGFNFCGSFHSHIKYIAKPSPYDFKLTKNYNELCLIYSTLTNQLKLYQKKKHTFNKINLKIRKLPNK